MGLVEGDDLESRIRGKRRLREVIRDDSGEPVEINDCLGLGRNGRRPNRSRRPELILNPKTQRFLCSCVRICYHPGQRKNPIP